MSTPTDDIVEIQQLLARYAVTITQGDIAGLLKVFVPDGSYSAFGDTYRLAKFPELVAAAPKGLYLTGNGLVELDGDTAAGTQPLCFIEHATHDMRIGYYRDTYVRTSDDWRLKTRAMTFIRRSGAHDSGAPTCRRPSQPVTLTMETAQFRAKLQAWLDHNDLTPGPERSLAAQVEHMSRVRRALYDAHWMRYGWPPEVGGCGGPAVLGAVVGEEVLTRGLAEPGIYSMVEVLAPTMISYAQPELAARMVPLLLSGREHWCQGFSEPGSGSDLASLTTRATARGENWVVNGQKVWTSYAQFAARCVLLARTAPGRSSTHADITAVFVDMNAPGVTVRPLRTMHGVDEFAEVYFDDVVVPGDRILGRPGDGWRVAMDLLPHERSTCFWHRIAYLYTRLDRLITEVYSVHAADEFALGAAHLALHTVRCRSRHTQRRLASGDRLGPETSIDKVLLAAAEQRLYDTVRDILPGAIELDDTPCRPEYLYSRAATIYGGAAEIQRNIIARRLLDLGKE